MGEIICPCGKKIMDWRKGIYQVIRKDKEGKIIYAQCYHGITVINKAPDLYMPYLKDRVSLHDNPDSISLGEEDDNC